MKVQILVVEGCPNSLLAREAVERALAQAGARATIEEIVVSRNGYPGFAGSPTILVNGRDIQPTASDCGGLSCRIYANPENPGVPDLQSVVRAIESCEGSGSLQ